jgi:hypothetical protein
MADVFKVLSIDGGGLRGIIPAMVLAEIEERTGRPIAEKTFDLIAGTSTGGILALGLTMPGDDGKPRYTAKELVRLYEEQGARIFSHRANAIGGIFEERYPSEGMEGVLEDYFGEARLKDALTRVFVTSYDIQLRVPFFFRARQPRATPTTTSRCARSLAPPPRRPHISSPPRWRLMAKSTTTPSWTVESSPTTRPCAPMARPERYWRHGIRYHRPSPICSWSLWVPASSPTP